MFYGTFVLQLQMFLINEHILQISDNCEGASGEPSFHCTISQKFRFCIPKKNVSILNYHTSVDMFREILDQQYPHRWIGRGGPRHWPARSLYKLSLSVMCNCTSSSDVSTSFKRVSFKYIL
jgi:hypothetical protein